MTCPGGTVPIRLAHHRALQLARWLESYRPQDKSILGTVGMTEREVEELKAREVNAIEDLRLRLFGNKPGRPRKPVSVYYLPVASLRLLDTGHAALSLPWKLRRVVRQLLRATRLKKGPKLSPATRARYLESGYYDNLETVRRYIWKIRKSAERLRQSQLRSAPGSVDDWTPPKAGTPAFALLSVMAARQWLV